MAVSRAGVVAAGELSAAVPAAWAGLCCVTGPVPGLVGTQTGDGYRRLARRTVNRPSLHPGGRLLPRRGGLLGIFQLDLDLVVARNRAVVAAGKRISANL